MIWRRSSATSCCRTPPGLASPRRAGRPADDGAEAGQPGAGRVGRAPAHHRPAGSRAGTRLHPGHSVAGIGGRIRRPRAARAHDCDDVGVGHSSSTATGAGRGGAGVGRLSPFALGPKEGLALLNGTQFSTASRWPRCSRERVFRTALVTGALSTDAARGSDTPFDARIHPLRRHRGQIAVAAALRGLMEGARSARRTVRTTTGCRTRTACAASRR